MLAPPHSARRGSRGHQVRHPPTRPPRAVRLPLPPHGSASSRSDLGKLCAGRVLAARPSLLPFPSLPTPPHPPRLPANLPSPVRPRELPQPRKSPSPPPPLRPCSSPSLALPPRPGPPAINSSSPRRLLPHPSNHTPGKQEARAAYVTEGQRPTLLLHSLRAPFPSPGLQ
ncbi:hypothetical protein BS78_07G167600 [Paspalum vaginatum]|nr:hypothetical protein BS78_07G167600 [Paspalum vaginatum]